MNLSERKTGIGGSDIATVLGLNPWKTAFQLWKEKTGREEQDFSPAAQERMHWGTVLESVIADHYADTTGRRVQRVNAMLRHPEHQIALAHIDRAITAADKRARWNGQELNGALGILEVKTANAFAVKDFEEAVPTNYWLQCQWYMGITKTPWADLAVLFGGQIFSTYRIEADQALFSEILEAAQDWWDRHITTDTPPDPQTEDEARQRWASHIPGKAIELSQEAAETATKLVEIQADIAALESEEKKLRDALLCAIGDAEIFLHQGRKLGTWKANKDSIRFDQTLFKSEHPDLYREFTKTTPGSRVLRLAK